MLPMENDWMGPSLHCSKGPADLMYVHVICTTEHASIYFRLATCIVLLQAAVTTLPGMCTAYINTFADHGCTTAVKFCW